MPKSTINPDWTSLQTKIMNDVRYFTSLFGRGLIDSLDREDITQNVQMKAFSSLDSFDASKGTLNQWVRKIAKNCVLDAIINNAKRKGLIVSLAIPSFEGEEIDLAGIYHSPETDSFCDMTVECKEILERISKVLSHIKDRDRRFYDMASLGFRPSEIAVSEGVNANVVSISLSRTKDKIRKSLLPFTEDYGCGRQIHHTPIEREEYHTQEEIAEFEYELYCQTRNKPIIKGVA